MLVLGRTGKGERQFYRPTWSRWSDECQLHLATVVSVSQLRAWVVAREGETQEFKLSTGQRTDAAKAVCAMLNHRGGRVLIGVTPDGEILGQQLGGDSLNDLMHELSRIEPPAFPIVEQTPVENDRTVISVLIDKGSRRPYAYGGRVYRRSGDTNRELSKEEAHRLFLEQVHGIHRWENEDATGWNVSDLDQDEIVRTLEEAVRRGRASDPGSRDPAEILRGFGLMRDGTLLRAAVALFARRDHLLPDFPQFLLKVAKFKGNDRTEFLDNRQFLGNAFELLQQAERFLRDSLPVAGRVVPTLFERVDDPLYPLLALREALANAFCHRDYSLGGGSVALAVYDDKLEVASSGSLHFGLKPEDLFHPHESLPWNPLVASVFYKRGIIEAWGRGTLKMAELAQQAGLPKPQIEEVAGAVVVRFFPSRYVPPRRIGHDLTERQLNILALLGSHRYLALGQIAERLDKPAAERTIQQDLNFLKQLGLVELSGHGRGARWYIKS